MPRYVGICIHHSAVIRSSNSTTPLPVSGFTNAGTPRSSSSTSTRCGTFSARSLSGLFRIPHSALGFIVDQRVAAFGDARPWLDGDDVVQHRALEPELDLVDGGAERAAPAGPGGGARVAREELQLGGARREPGELDGEPLHGPGGGRLLEARLERRDRAARPPLPPEAPRGPQSCGARAAAAGGACPDRAATRPAAAPRGTSPPPRGER